MLLTNNLTTDQLEVLGLLQEEAADITQALSKIRRFGTEFKSTDNTVTSIQQVERKITNFLMVTELASRLGLFDTAIDEDDYPDMKKEELKQWTNLPHSLIESI